MIFHHYSFSFICSGYIPLDVIFQRYLHQHIIKKTFTAKLYFHVNRVEYAKNDYLRKFITDYEYWLLNKEWYVLSTIKKGTPIPAKSIYNQQPLRME